MKVLYVIPTYETAWAFGGGAVKAVSQLCRGLVQQGLDVTVYTTDADGKGSHLDVPLGSPIKLGGVEVWYFHCSFGAKDAFYSMSLATQLDKTVNNFDIVHVSAFWQLIQVSVSKACRKFNVPYIVSPHGCLMDWGLGRKKWKRFPYWCLFTRPTMLKASAIHYVSKDECVKSRKRFNKTALSYIVPNCLVSKDYVVPPEKIISFRDFLEIPKDAFIVSFLSLIRPRKGLELLIKAVSHLKSEKLILLVGGAAEDNKYLINLKGMARELGIDSKIKWLGLIEPEDLGSFYSVSDVFVLPSFEEAFGMVVVEAMACGTAVLVSHGIPIWEEVVQDKAGLVIDSSPQDIADKIRKLILNPNLLQLLSKNARASVKNRYDVERVACLMKKSYEDILSNHRSPELQWQ